MISCRELTTAIAWSIGRSAGATHFVTEAGIGGEFDATNAIHHSVGLERFFRDLHVHGQHISGLSLNFEFGGSVLLGAPPPTSLYT